MIGLSSSEFWEMTPREFFNAWIGYSETRNKNLEAIRDIVYGASKYNAANTAFSKDQSKAISRQKFPWEKGHKKEPMSGKQIAQLLNLISKPEKQN